jgi:hypothetical protein
VLDGVESDIDRVVESVGEEAGRDVGDRGGGPQRHMIDERRAEPSEAVDISGAPCDVSPLQTSVTRTAG